MASKIKWCDETWNPVVGCSPVSDGCYNCYAARMASRFCEHGEVFEGLIGCYGWNDAVRFRYERLGKPFRWRKPRRIFVTSMGDLWHPSVADEQIAAVFGTIAATPQHIYLDLTKRPERRLEWYTWEACASKRINKMDNDFVRHLLWEHAPDRSFSMEAMEKLLYQWPPPNYWAGVSVENQITANERIPLLIRTPAAKRFVSFEPAIGWVEFYREIFDLDLVIVGAETGPGKRPMDLEWARSVRYQCAAAGVPFWFKKDSDGNETLDGVTHHPEFWR